MLKASMNNFRRTWINRKWTFRANVSGMCFLLFSLLNLVFHEKRFLKILRTYQEILEDWRSKLSFSTLFTSSLDIVSKYLSSDINKRIELGSTFLEKNQSFKISTKKECWDKINTEKNQRKLGKHLKCFFLL